MTYEMQWTVRSFLHQTSKWNLGENAAKASAGAQACAFRQQDVWNALATRADKDFRSINAEYRSPFEA